MTRIKTVIIDDESLARKRIINLLADDKEIHIVGEFSNGAEAIAFLKSHEVDILYLDIHMPETNGFSVLNQLDEIRRPFVIFATADKASAIKAFEYKALDYLLKPFRKIRFNESLNHAKAYIQLKKKAQLSDQVAQLLAHQKNQQPPIILADGNDQIDFDDIIYAKADGNYLRMYRSHSDYTLVRMTMNHLMTSILPDHCLRIHRSLVINPYFIKKVKYIGNNSFEIQLDDDIFLRSGRAYKEKIAQYQALHGS